MAMYSMTANEAKARFGEILLKAQREPVHISKYGKPVSVPSLQSAPALFPFTLTRPLVYLVLNSENLVLRSEGPSNQFVALRSV